MNYKINYCCFSHAGKCRHNNQDNFICNGIYIDEKNNTCCFPLIGCLTNVEPSLVGVFDGMGGEECGEIASFIAAKTASEVLLGESPLEDMLNFCGKANNQICNYAAKHNISSMGTTAAILAFTKTEVVLCNIGDSKIFLFSNKKLEQISVDHYDVTAYGQKPPLSQNLGIPAIEMIIEPYIAEGRYNDGDIYLICSDGLTDMVTTETIANILINTDYNNAAIELLSTAIKNGGKDNITIILCKLEKIRINLITKVFKRKRRTN